MTGIPSWLGVSHGYSNRFLITRATNDDLAESKHSRRRRESDLGEEPVRVLAESRRGGRRGVGEIVEEKGRPDRGYGPPVAGRREDRPQHRRLRRANCLEHTRNGPGG